MKNTINYATLSVDEIIFIDRNQDYGAYELRRTYNRRMKQSLFGALFLAGFLCSYQSLMALYHPVHAHKTIELITQISKDITIEKKIELKERTVEAKPKIAEPRITPPAPRGTVDPSTTTAGAILVPSASATAADSIPDHEQLANLAISDHDSKGTTAGNAVGSAEGDLLAMVVTRPAAAALKIVDYAEVMPEYPGGERAMMEFILNNIRYPEQDRDMGIQGRVTVGFVIDEHGQVTELKIMRGLTRTLNEESIRVVSRLRTFKPGSQGGHPVKVRYNLPISYTLRSDGY